MSGSCSSQLEPLSSTQPDPTTTTTTTVSGILRLGPDELLLLAAMCGRDAPLVAQLCKGTRHVWLHIRQDAHLLATNLTTAHPKAFLPHTTPFRCPLELVIGTGLAHTASDLLATATLLRAGANVHARGSLALQRAASRGHAHVVQLLLDYGAGRFEGTLDVKARVALRAFLTPVNHDSYGLESLLHSLLQSYFGRDLHAYMPLLVGLCQAVVLGHCGVVEAILDYMDSGTGSGAWLNPPEWDREHECWISCNDSHISTRLDPRTLYLQYAFLDAAYCGKPDTCQLLLRRLGPKAGRSIVPLLSGLFGITEVGLGWAAGQGHWHVVFVLLECLAQGPPGPGSPNAAAVAKLAVGLLEAAARQRSDPSIIIEQLLEWVEGVPGTAQDPQVAKCIKGALFGCAKKGNAGAVRLLLDRCGIDVHWREDKQLADACEARDCPEVVRLLLERGAEQQAIEDEHLCLACSGGDAAAVLRVQGLLKDGADVHTRSGAALRNACWAGNEAVVCLLLKYGADVNADGTGGNERLVAHCKPLVQAAKKAHVGVMRLLLAAGADVHAQGDLPLLTACRNGNVRAVQLLLEAGADVHAGDGRALVEACRLGRLGVVRALLAAGADPGVQGGEPLRAVLARYPTHFYLPGIEDLLLAK